MNTAVCQLALALAVLTGCSSHNDATTRPSAHARGERALEDPMGYSPDMGSTDISGGKINELDRKALKKDMDHVLNP
jgi:hypothetical protein